VIVSAESESLVMRRRIPETVPEQSSQRRRFNFVELEELRQRLLLRSKSSDIPPVAHPVQISEVALSQAASKLKWESGVSPSDLAARMANKNPKSETSSARVDNVSANKEPAPERIANAATPEAKSPAAEPAAPQTESISMLASTVEQLSAPTEVFREHFAQLGALLAPIDTAIESTEQVLKRTAGLYERLASLAGNFQSVKAFAEQVRTLSASFEPMKALNGQLDLVMEALYANVKEVSAALAPVKTFQGKVRQLTNALDSIEQLEGQISELAELFRPTSEKPAQPEGAAQEEKSARVAHAA
jgi:hypothetical protein